MDPRRLPGHRPPPGMRVAGAGEEGQWDHRPEPAHAARGVQEAYRVAGHRPAGATPGETRRGEGTGDVRCRGEAGPLIPQAPRVWAFLSRWRGRWPAAPG